MIKEIEMFLPNYMVKISNDVCTINDKEIPISGEEIDDIIRILRDWKYIYSSLIPSGEHYYILIKSSKSYEYKFQNSFPDNFSELEDLLGELYAKN